MSLSHPGTRLFKAKQERGRVLGFLMNSLRLCVSVVSSSFWSFVLSHESLRREVHAAEQLRPAWIGMQAGERGICLNENKVRILMLLNHREQ